MSPTRKLGAVLGHARARTILEAESAAKRLAHAYLFVGPVGCGRGTLALALFMSQVCETGGEEPCGTCGPCRRALAWQHEDLIVLAPPTGQASAQIKAEEVREAIRRLSFAPQGPLRLVLIRQAEHMNLTSANVLLKTLEEPPPNNILVLTVQDAGEILPTLVSRCRRMNLSPLPETLVAEELERRGVEPDAARLKAALCGGSLGRALKLDQDRLLGEIARLTGQLANPGGALSDWAFADEMMRSFRGHGPIDRQGLLEVLDLWSLHIRDLAVVGAGRPQAALLPGPPPQPKPLAQTTQAFARIRKAQGMILGNAQPELTLTVLLGELRSALG